MLPTVTILAAYAACDKVSDVVNDIVCDIDLNDNDRERVEDSDVDFVRNFGLSAGVVGGIVVALRAVGPSVVVVAIVVLRVVGPSVVVVVGCVVIVEADIWRTRLNDSTIAETFGIDTFHASKLQAVDDS